MLNHEMKHDGFRILAHRRGRSIRLVTRNGHDLADRFPLAAEAIEVLPIRSCVIDGEAIVCDDSGLAVFDLIRGHTTNARAILCAFDLLEVNGEDIRREPIEDRKRRLAGLLRLPHEGVALNEQFGGDGAMIYKHACALGCEGIVSKRLGSPYRAGRSALDLDCSGRIGRASLISRLSDSPSCPAQRVRVRRMRVMVRWARGVAAAAVAITRLESERQYERRAGSAAVVITRLESERQ